METSALQFQFDIHSGNDGLHPGMVYIEIGGVRYYMTPRGAMQLARNLLASVSEAGKECSDAYQKQDRSE